jgi:arylsulfatase A-like enzyme
LIEPQRLLPNVLFIITDQHRADHLGCYGNRTVKTPNIDGIAAHGTTFERFYVASAICMPNRATLMTGRMPSLHGVRHNGIPLSLSATVFTELLRARGYHTALIGKSHLQNMSGKAALTGAPQNGGVRLDGFLEAQHELRSGPAYDQEREPQWDDPAHDVRLPYYGFDHVELCDGHGDLTFGHYGRWLKARDPLGDQLRGRANAIPDPRFVAPQAWRTRLPVELYPTTYIAERAEAFLHEHAASSADRPFFLKCSFPDPHHPFTPPGSYWDMYDPAAIAAPETCRPPGDDAPPHVRALHAERRAGKTNLDSVSAIAIDEREAREAIALTYGMITLIDDAVGRILAALDATGMRRDTIIVFTADHGDLMGDHGLLFKAPIHYQGLIRVPFIWSEPDRTTATRCATLSGTIDIARTLLERTGTAPYNGIQGRSLLPDISGATAASEVDAILIEEDGQRVIPGLKAPARCRTLVTDRWRLSLYAGETWGELYDLRDDPDERRNLWSAPAYLEQRASLLEELTRRMADANDRSPLPTSLA